MLWGLVKMPIVEAVELPTERRDMVATRAGSREPMRNELNAIVVEATGSRRSVWRCWIAGSEHI